MANPKGNPQNLKRGNPTYEFKSSEQASEMGRRGGKKSQEVQHKKKVLAEIGQQLLEGMPDEKAIEEIKALYPEFANEDISKKVVIMAKMINQAMNGDQKAFEIVRDTIGEKPIQTNINIEKEYELDEKDEEILNEATEKYLSEHQEIIEQYLKKNQQKK